MSEKLPELLDRLSNLLLQRKHKLGVSHGLNSAQVGVLLFLSRANRYSNTPAAVTEYLGLTKGTVSQSILKLEESGWLRRRADDSDGRVVRVELTARARKMLEQYGPAAMNGIPQSQVAGAEFVLQTLLTALQRANGGRSFGVCRTCRHFQTEGKDSFRCGLTGEPLAVPQTLMICREHELKSA